MLRQLLVRVLEQLENSEDPSDERLLARLESRTHTQEDIRALVERIERLAQLSPPPPPHKKTFS
jgi:hypothetical protein